jgi:hypothetical protein
MIGPVCAAMVFNDLAFSLDSVAHAEHGRGEKHATELEALTQTTTADREADWHAPSLVCLFCYVQFS